MKQLFFILITLLFLVSCNEESQYSDPNYPTIIKDIDNAQLDDLYNTLLDIDLYNCTTLDYQGRLIQYLNDDLCEVNDTTPASYSQSDILLLTKTLVAQNVELFGVADTSEMEVISIVADNGIRYENYFTADSIVAPPYWTVTYDRQIIDNLDVIGTELKFTIDAEGIKAASGKWYSNIYVPLTDVIREIDAQEMLYNYTLTYGRTSYTPQENSTWFEANKLIFPVYQSGQLIFHVCWAIHPENWEVIIDTQDGQILSTVNIGLL